MLSRLLPRPSHFRLLTQLSSSPRPLQHPHFTSLHRFLSTNNNNNSNNNNGKDPSFSDPWKLSRESDGSFDSFFSGDSGHLSGIGGSESPAGDEESWLKGNDGDKRNVFQEIDEPVSGKSVEEEWLTGEVEKPWSLTEEQRDDLFNIEGDKGDISGISGENALQSLGDEDLKTLEEGEKHFTAVIKGPNRAFGDLIATSGITNAMLDSLIALKDLEGVDGLPPLSEIEDMRYRKNTGKSGRADIERLKQEEAAKSRVRQVDDKGRAYGTGRRKCSVARVWIQPGDGKLLINDKQFDVYFPSLDHRAALLRPFSETKTLGLWDVNCTVEGGGYTGQVGAIQLGISRALQNWEPDLRPPLRAAGFLTRDPRVVERKKPGKAKARKSFQWVKR